jgi:heme/copper-type cytochrome/quinol oxidase subunit 1
MDRSQEIRYWALIIILGMVAGALWFHPLFAGHIINEKALKVLGISFAMWLVGMINSAAMLLYELWERRTERRKP